MGEPDTAFGKMTRGKKVAPAPLRVDDDRSYGVRPQAPRVMLDACSEPWTPAVNATHDSPPLLPQESPFKTTNIRAGAALLDSPTKSDSAPPSPAGAPDAAQPEQAPTDNFAFTWFKVRPVKPNRIVERPLRPRPGPMAGASALLPSLLP